MYRRRRRRWPTPGWTRFSNRTTWTSSSPVCSYSGNAGAAGVPALTIPNGLDANGRPQGIILSGPYLSDPQLIAVGYALEQALNGRVAPDLEATIAQIDAVTGK